MRSMLRKYLALLCVLSCVCCAAARAEEITVIDLHYPSAEELLPVLQPLLNKGEVLTGQGQRLILKANATGRENLQQVIAQLDRAPQRLLITVQQLRSSNDQATGMGASISLGDARRSQVVTKVYSTTDADNDSFEQRIQTVAGQEAFFQVGQARPVVTQRAIVSGQVTSISERTEWQTTQSGFTALARVNGETVSVAIAPRRANADGNQVNFQVANTTVSGRVSEWIEIGGIQEDVQTESQGIVHRTDSRGQGNQRIRIKIDVVP